MGLSVLGLSLYLFFLSQFFSSTLQFPLDIWPMPRTIRWSQQHSVCLSPDFLISSPSHPYLSRASQRYRRQILAEHHIPLVSPAVDHIPAPPLKALTITVADLSSPLIHGVNESYTLSIPPAGAGSTAVLTAATPWGAIRGLETFSQLAWGDPTRIAAGINISDSPIFEHRGVLVDTSRNYYGVEDLMRTIEAMSWNKLNVFHWHISDSHSFPLVLPSEPELAAKGSYGDEMTYSAVDVKKLVEYGLERGVRVVPEIDMPAHTGSWAEAYPEIVSCANMFWWPAGSKWRDRLASEPGTGQLNPLNPKTYEVAKNVIRDVSTMFPEPFFHGGGDEVVPGCWKADPSIQAYLSNDGTLNQLLEAFINSTYPYVASLNRTIVYWEDLLLDPTINISHSLLPRDNTILQTWNKGATSTKKIVALGYRAIVSSAEFYYLDCGHGGFVGNDSEYDKKPGSDQGNGGSWCAPFKTWQTIYNYDITFGLSEEEAKLVIGGEVALWSEQADPTVLDSRLWPRASAMAEALWSGNRDETGMKRYAEATDRLNEWRHRMVARGVGAEPIQPLWCVRNPGMCNTVNAF